MSWISDQSCFAADRWKQMTKDRLSQTASSCESGDVELFNGLLGNELFNRGFLSKTCQSPCTTGLVIRSCTTVHVCFFNQHRLKTPQSGKYTSNRARCLDTGHDHAPLTAAITRLPSCRVLRGFPFELMTDTPSSAAIFPRRGRAGTTGSSPSNTRIVPFSRALTV